MRSIGFALAATALAIFLAAPASATAKGELLVFVDGAQFGEAAEVGAGRGEGLLALLRSERRSGARPPSNLDVRRPGLTSVQARAVAIAEPEVRIASALTLWFLEELGVPTRVGPSSIAAGVQAAWVGAAALVRLALAGLAGMRLSRAEVPRPIA